MAIAMRVAEFMQEHGARYDVLTHPHTGNSIETAELAHVPEDKLVKSVVLEDDDGFVMAVLPASRHVRLARLNQQMNRQFRLVPESRIAASFPDCERGAIPPLGPVYGMRTVLDESVSTLPEVYFEAGDHERLVHMSRDQFMALLPQAERGQFTSR